MIEGDTRSFRELFESYKTRVYNTAISYLQNKSDAEEITQDVFVEVFHSAHQFRGESSVQTWIYRITINKCHDLIRHRKRKKRFGFLISILNSDRGELNVDVPDFNHPGVLLENQENAAYLFKAIEKLPEQQKAAFILSQVEELPQKEIAAVLSISEKAVESLIQRAKANLRKELENFYPYRRKH